MTFYWILYDIYAAIYMIAPFFVLYHFRKAWMSERMGEGWNRIAAQIVILSASIFFLVLGVVSMTLSTMEMIDFPYAFSQRFPHYYGVVIEDKDGVKGIQDQESGEILYDPDWSIHGIADLDKNEVEAGDYVEVLYLPHFRGMTVIREGESARWHETEEKEYYKLEAVRKEIRIIGIFWGLAMLTASGVWSYQMERKRRQRYLYQDPGSGIWRYRWLDEVSLVLGTLPLLLMSLGILGFWVFLWEDTAALQKALSFLGNIWIFGVMLEAFPYQTKLTVQRETFQIGAAECFKKTYEKSGIQEIRYTDGKGMEIFLKNGKTIRSRISREAYERTKKALLDKSAMERHEGLQKNQSIVYEGEDAKKYYSECIEKWKYKLRVWDVFWLIVLMPIVMVFWVLTSVIVNADNTFMAVWGLFLYGVVLGSWAISVRKKQNKNSPRKAKSYECRLIYIQEYRKKKKEAAYLVYEDGEERRYKRKGIAVYGEIKEHGYASLVCPSGGSEEFIHADCSWAELEEDAETVRTGGEEMERQERLKKYAKETLAKEDAEKYICTFYEDAEQKRKIIIIRSCVTIAIISSIAMIEWKIMRPDAYLWGLVLVVLLFLSVVFLQWLLKGENLKIMNETDPAGSRKLVYIESIDKKTEEITYIYAEGEEIQRTKEKVKMIGKIEKEAYAACVQIDKKYTLICEDTEWADNRDEADDLRTDRS